jgi:hypothetical protein
MASHRLQWLHIGQRVGHQHGETRGSVSQPVARTARHADQTVQSQGHNSAPGQSEKRQPLVDDEVDGRIGHHLNRVSYNLGCNKIGITGPAGIVAN